MNKHDLLRWLGTGGKVAVGLGAMLGLVSFAWQIRDRRRKQAEQASQVTAEKQGHTVIVHSGVGAISRVVVVLADELMPPIVFCIAWLRIVAGQTYTWDSGTTSSHPSCH